MTITLNGTTGITTPDVNVTAQSSNIVTTGNITAVDATLSGGVYVGGTVAANYLDDYEEGTFTPNFYPLSGAWTAASSSGFYTKIGNTVVVQMYLTITNVGTASSHINFTGLPFLAFNPSVPAGNRAAIGVIREDAITGVVSQLFINGGGYSGSCQTLAGGVIAQASGYVYDFTVTYFTN